MATASESTPLLSEPAQAVEATDSAVDSAPQTEDEATLPSSAHFQRPRKLLTILALICSIITGSLLIAIHVMLTMHVFSFNFWDQMEAINNMGFLIFLSLLFAPINLIWNFPVVFNILLDPYLAVSIITWASNMISAWPGDIWCVERDYYGKKPDLDKGPVCHSMLLAVRIVIGIAAGFAMIVAVCHTVLFLLRIVALWKTKFWKRPMPFPTGSITLEVSIKVQRQERGEVQPVVAS
ncbi:uncharacterized protein LY89DRAFT_676334 [Mollisia scopiformis]|uniref:Uncharacterized protein n=1 Tax=Mollisia scopiformis TaxID=149040 RepID=A0A132B981_MOLSC|nr:uncharacterized protein LY89DRAFT_676334 [Mollisia scopiformis]KUJ08956.1 hypothetical protein LY89DRAFT_676334 [Mollisia scopiformis]